MRHDTTQTPSNTSNRDRPGADETPKIRWTIRGISPETRSAVKKAAAKDGLTISDWVDRILQRAAADSLKGGTPGLALPPDLLAAIDDISRKLDHIDSEIQRDPERMKALSREFGNRLDELRNRMNGSFERLQSAANSVVDTVVVRTDAAMNQSKRLADRALERIIDTSDSALDSMRQFRRSDRDSTQETDSAKAKG